MIKIQSQPAFVVNQIDFKVVYSANGSAIIAVALMNDNQVIKTDEIPMTKEETDQWTNSDEIIISKIAEKFPSIDLTKTV